MPATAAAAAQQPLDSFVTTGEILRQPDIWRGFAAKAEAFAQQAQGWLRQRAHDEIWFCGAGSSSFIGDCLASYLNSAPGPARYRSVPTTDLVATPHRFFRPGVRILVVSFGRSGDSSETIGTLDLLDALAPDADRLNITCNGASMLATRKAPPTCQQRVLVLPAETNDAGFAMTSSFTTMFLAALATFDFAPPMGAREMFETLAEAAEAVLRDSLKYFAKVESPKRVAFLGCGPLTATAHESALKVLELASGHIPVEWNSTLGFRHGPKSFVDSETKVFVFVSSDPSTRRYDLDLADELERQFGVSTVVRLGEAAVQPTILVPVIGRDVHRCVLFVLIAQVAAVTLSHRLGFNVDNPFVDGNLSRVVSGVNLYVSQERKPASCGAIDVGGTKIEACLFDAALSPLKRRRTPTPVGDYESLLEAIVDSARWLEKEGGTDLSIGLGLPGLVDPRAGISATANIPASGRPLRTDLMRRLGRPVPMENDCKLFALSEARSGAGARFETVFGLVLGTGVGGGLCRNGRLASSLNGLAGEVGHIGMPTALINRHGLPTLRCGCGRDGCYETLASGPGIVRLAEYICSSSPGVPQTVFENEAFNPARDAWVDIVAELLLTIQLAVDPDCVVLGGGLCHAPGIVERLTSALASRMLGGLHIPVIAVAQHGDASGVRGAAMLAREGLGGPI
jgi:predicted NBD/HSP70 family sugar kinase/fructoselysine-6-P-deglycase FrlB-like protein